MDESFVRPLLFSLLAGLSTALGGSVIFVLPGRQLYPALCCFSATHSSPHNRVGHWVGPPLRRPERPHWHVVHSPSTLKFVAVAPKTTAPHHRQRGDRGIAGRGPPPPPPPPPLCRANPHEQGRRRQERRLCRWLRLRRRLRLRRAAPPRTARRAVLCRRSVAVLGTARLRSRRSAILLVARVQRLQRLQQPVARAATRAAATRAAARLAADARLRGAGASRRHLKRDAAREGLLHLRLHLRLHHAQLERRRRRLRARAHLCPLLLMGTCMWGGPHRRRMHAAYPHTACACAPHVHRMCTACTSHVHSTPPARAAQPAAAVHPPAAPARAPLPRWNRARRRPWRRARRQPRAPAAVPYAA